MKDLVQWLRAQLDEDERIARAATPGPWEQVPDRVGWLASAEYWHVVDCSGTPAARENAEHVAVWAPARVLREIDAKRRTLVRCEEARLAANPMLVHFAKQTIWEMAQPYADRPGYREEWRPQ
jgi:hypothetical protein